MEVLRLTFGNVFVDHIGERGINQLVSEASEVCCEGGAENKTRQFDKRCRRYT